MLQRFTIPPSLQPSERSLERWPETQGHGWIQVELPASRPRARAQDVPETKDL